MSTGSVGAAIGNAIHDWVVAHDDWVGGHFSKLERAEAEHRRLARLSVGEQYQESLKHPLAKEEQFPFGLSCETAMLSIPAIPVAAGFAVLATPPVLEIAAAAKLAGNAAVTAAGKWLPSNAPWEVAVSVALVAEKVGQASAVLKAVSRTIPALAVPAAAVAAIGTVHSRPLQALCADVKPYVRTGTAATAATP